MTSISRKQKRASPHIALRTQRSSSSTSSARSSTRSLSKTKKNRTVGNVRGERSKRGALRKRSAKSEKKNVVRSSTNSRPATRTPQKSSHARGHMRSKSHWQDLSLRRTQPRSIPKCCVPAHSRAKSYRTSRTYRCKTIGMRTRACMRCRRATTIRSAKLSEKIEKAS